MSAAIKRSARATLAILLSFAVLCGLLCVPGMGKASFAQADENSGITISGISISGIAFMQPQATGWDLLKVDDLGNDAIYITIEKDGKPLSNPIKFTASENSDVSGNTTDKGDPIAQIVSVEMIAAAGATEDQSARTLLGKKDARSTYTITVTDALMQGNELYNGTIYPVYGKIVDSDGSTEYVLLGIRTASDEEAAQPRNLGVGATYYKQNTATESYPRPYSLHMVDGIDNVFEDNAFIVTYEEDDKADIQGFVNYVDASTGEVVMTETFTGIGKDPTMVPIKMSFIAQDPDDENATKYYRAVSQLAGTKVPLGIPNEENNVQATYTVNVIEVKDMTGSCYPVTIQYVDEKDDLLWTDTVYVKGNGYRYTLPNTFSMNTYDDITASEGVNFYRLDKVIGGVVVDGTAAEEGLTAQGASTREASITTGASEGNGTEVNLTRNMKDANFVIGENGQRIVKAVYQSQDATKTVDFTLVEIDGETGQALGTITETVTPDYSFSYVVEDKVVDGKTYVPWVGNPDKIEYTWESLGQAVDLLQYVYYVPEGYVPGEGYDITVQYMNVATGAILRTETLAVDPEMTDYLSFVGDARFTQSGNEYVRLDGQESGIRHAYFSPNRTYTIYYRDVNDTLRPVVAPVQIIGGTTTPTGGSVNAIPTAIPDAAEDGPLAEAGVTPGDGTVIINDNDNPLANLDGQDTATERVIEENENPLAFGPGGISPAAIAGIVAGALVVIGVIAFLLMRRRKNAQDNHSM